MVTLTKIARNEMIFGTTGQAQPVGLAALNQGRRRRRPRRTLRQRARRVRNTAIGASIGYAIPATMHMGRALLTGQTLTRPVNFQTMIGSALGGYIGSRIGE